ncbi:MAG: hypothetical protein RL718_116 [Actinomycetota bacterium]|jgi:uncharacterized protein (DUF305 family)
MKAKFITLSALALLLLAGCGQILGQSAAPQDAQAGSSEQMFAEMMIPHHEQALEMSELAPSRTDNPEVLAIAEKIRSGQEPEILLMQGWLDGHGGHSDHAGHTMDGMLTEAQLAELSAATGTEFEKLFLEGMIQHHEGALAMLSMIEDSKFPEAIELKKQIETAQKAEIAQMKELLSRY